MQRSTASHKNEHKNARTGKEHEPRKQATVASIIFSTSNANSLQARREITRILTQFLQAIYTLGDSS